MNYRKSKKTLPPFSAIKIGGDEKYFIHCSLTEYSASTPSKAASESEGRALKACESVVNLSNLLAVVPKADRKYPEVLIQSDKRVINQFTLRIENENFETPDFSNEEIMYVLKIY